MSDATAPARAGMSSQSLRRKAVEMKRSTERQTSNRRAGECDCGGMTVRGKSDEGALRIDHESSVDREEVCSWEQPLQGPEGRPRSWAVGKD